MTGNDEIKESIIRLVKDSTGIKATELIAKLATHDDRYPQDEDILELIEQVAVAGDILELEYLVPQMDYRIKSIYFPKGTEFLNVK